MDYLFPSGIAEGNSFCNRMKERKKFKQSIERIEHTVVVAPRRYGKTSLITKVMQEMDIAYGWIELLSATSLESVQTKIINAVGGLVYELAPDIKKLQLKFKQFFIALKPDIVLSALGQKVVLHPLSSSAETITATLLELDRYVLSLNKKAVIVFDEFQQLAELENSRALEASIRYAVERSKAVSYIFSGSNRHMLVEMFGASERPLYRLCNMFGLERIAPKEYFSFLKKAALQQWQAPLDEAVFSKIMELTERHPYYVNILCNRLWKYDNLPNVDRVEKAWDKYVTSHKSIIVGDILNLSLNQRKILTMLAQHPTAEPYGAEFQSKTGVSLSSMKQAFGVLIDKDMVYRDNGVLTVLDPAIRYYLGNY